MYEGVLWFFGQRNESRAVLQVPLLETSNDAAGVLSSGRI